jgi:hypothetical protein
MLYNHFGRLTQDAFELDDLLQELEGDVSDQVIQDWITRHSKNETQLINSACGVINEYQTMANVYDEELKRLRERRESYESKIAAIKKMILEYQTKIGKKVIETGLYKSSVTANGGIQPLDAVEKFVNNPTELPLPFIIAKPLLRTEYIRELLTRENADSPVLELPDPFGIKEFRVETNEFEELELVQYYWENDQYIDSDNKVGDPTSRELVATLKNRGTHLRIK